MPRTYAVSFEKVSVSAVQDLITIIGGSGVICRILEIGLSDVDATLPTAQMLALRCRLLPATVTPGSGGSTPTPQKLDRGDSAAIFTAHANDTSKTTTNGTAATIREDGTHLYSGYTYQFPKPPLINSTEAFVFELITAPGATCIMSGTVTVEEIGG